MGLDELQQQIMSRSNGDGAITYNWHQLRPLFKGATDADRWGKMVEWTKARDIVFLAPTLGHNAQGTSISDDTEMFFRPVSA